MLLKPTMKPENYLVPFMNAYLDNQGKKCLLSLSGNCAHYQKGGWWYNSCAHSNLNGVWYRGGHYRSRYQDGVYWAEFRGGAYSLKKVVMMIRPNPNTFH